jgi:hypothetical protein
MTRRLELAVSQLTDTRTVLTVEPSSALGGDVHVLRVSDGVRDEAQGTWQDEEQVVTPTTTVALRGLHAALSTYLGIDRLTVLIVEHFDDPILASVHPSPQTARARLHAIVLERWNVEAPVPDDPEEAIREYFAGMGHYADYRLVDVDLGALSSQLGAVGESGTGVTGSGVVEEFATFCRCPQPDLDASKRCLLCGTQWRQAAPPTVRRIRIYHSDELGLVTIPEG